MVLNGVLRNFMSRQIQENATWSRVILNLVDFGVNT